MRVDLHEEGVEDLAGEWNALFAADPLATPFVSAGWVLACWRHYAGDARPWILGARVDGRLVGLAPLALRRRRGVRSLHILAEPLSDYWDVVAVPAERSAVLTAVGEELRRRAGEWDEIVLGRMPEHSETPAALERAGLTALRGRGFPAPGLELPGSFEDYLRALPGRRRSDIRRHLRWLDAGDVVLRPRLDPSELPAAVERWHALRTRQWIEQGRPLFQMQASETFARFMREVLLDLVPAGRALLWEFLAGDRLVGSYVNFVDDRAFYHYLGGYDPGERGLGIGQMVVGEGIRSSIEAGRRYFDFMIGAEPYKYDYGAADRRVEQLRVRSPRPRSVLALGLRKLTARLR